MARTVSELDELSTYLSGVLGRSEHHANGVEDVVLTLAGAIVWRNGDGNLKILEREGSLGNVLWVEISGSRYAFSYNHDGEAIEMRRGSVQGEVVRSFSNQSSQRDIREFFAGL